MHWFWANYKAHAEFVTNIKEFNVELHIDGILNIIVGIDCASSTNQDLAGLDFSTWHKYSSWSEDSSEGSFDSVVWSLTEPLFHKFLVNTVATVVFGSTRQHPCKQHIQ